MQVSVFGLGYVGCVTAACLARSGHQVTGVDVNEDKVGMINAAVAPVVEPGLEALISDVVRAGRLRATIEARRAIERSEVALICVGTPGRPNGQLEVEAIRRVGLEIGRARAGGASPCAVVLRSTVLPGTTDGVLIPALLAGAGDAPPFRVAVNPEFMREGSSLRDFSHPAFTLAGCEDEETAALLRRLYAGVDAPFVRASVRTAELVKYVSNAFHALKVCFGNEIGDVCAAFGTDAREVMRIFLMDRRLNVSEAYLRPGFAFGGSCLPKDLRALLYAARQADLSLPLLSAILPSNENQIREAVEAVLRLRRRRIGVVGLSFKPGTDDLRESPMVALVETLIGKGCDVRILDRSVAIARLVGANRRYIEEEIPHIASLMSRSAEDLLAHAEVIVIGGAGEEAARVLALSRDGQVVIDLTRGAVQAAERQAREEEVPCEP
ncbi:MAG: UDP-glucose/GDP-mannose dehydrogenase family protein [Acidobacteria bacterium]|nr:UDP-glucose/GDP-mannose dehydrogenase family protein [Acidobacteriota bacterium]